MMAFSNLVLIMAFLAFFQGQEVRSAAIGDIARNLQSDLILLDAGLNPQTRKSQRLSLDDVPAGGAVDMFYRYGFFSLSVRVVPRDDPGRWLIREPTANIFEPRSVVHNDVAGPDTFARQPIQIYLADDLQELMEAYFKDFKADGVEQPHKLFTGSWRLPTAAQYLGLSPSALDGSEHSYVLVKVLRNKGTKTVSGNIKLNSEAGQSAAQVQVGDSNALLKFVKNYGTHYFKSVTVGDAIYQVIAVSKDHMQNIKSSLGGRKTADLRDWANLHENYLAPWLVKETGELRAASGDKNLQRFLDAELRINGQFGSYPNLIEGLIRNPGNVQMLEELTTDSTAVIGLEFGSLRDFFPDLQVREFYDETFSAQSSLWGVNIK